MNVNIFDPMFVQTIATIIRDRGLLKAAEVLADLEIDESIANVLLRRATRLIYTGKTRV